MAPSPAHTAGDRPGSAEHAEQGIASEHGISDLRDQFDDYVRVLRHLDEGRDAERHDHTRPSGKLDHLWDGRRQYVTDGLFGPCRIVCRWIDLFDHLLGDFGHEQ